MFNNRIEFNRFSNLDSIEWRLVNYLLNSTTYSAEVIWKILYYASEDCLLQPNLNREQKLSIINTNVGEVTNKRVFITPYADDAWTEQSSHIHIFLDTVYPENHEIATVNVCFEALTHSKLGTILGEATGKENQEIGDVEFKQDGSPLILYKSRSTFLLKHLLAEFNGVNIEGIGCLQFNQKVNPYNKADHYLWNNRAFYGYSFKMSTHISGTSPEN